MIDAPANRVICALDLLLQMGEPAYKLSSPRRSKAVSILQSTKNAFLVHIARMKTRFLSRGAALLQPFLRGWKPAGRCKRCDVAASLPTRPV
jgi:hypothetical protein